MQDQIRKKILALVEEYYEVAHKQEPFKDGDPVPVSGRVYDSTDMKYLVESSLDFWLTSGRYATKFEKDFAKFFGLKKALLTNSGSSANLLAVFSLINPKNRNQLRPNDECLIPAICWSTSLWPIVQAGLKPKFIDVDIDNFNIDLKKIEQKITSKTKAIMAVHVLGNSTKMIELMKIVKKYNLTLIEDTCESLGSKFKNKFLGTFGKFGTYSFYVSHQLIAGEGGMLVCNDYNDYKIAHSLRAHGWDRGLKQNQNTEFNFINSGFNLRPLDLTAAIGLNQLKRLNKLINIRTNNRNKIVDSILKSPKWDNQFTFLHAQENLKPSWFGIPILLNSKFLKNKIKFLKRLNANGIETRPIISGNFLNQPSINLYNLNKAKEKFPVAQDIENRGFFIGLHTKNIEEKELIKLTNNLLSVN